MSEQRIYKNARNPVLPPDICVPDGEARVMPDGRLYVYGSWDKYPDFYCSGEYHVVSTSDMKNWQIHDTSFTAGEVPWLGAVHERYPEEMDWANPSPFIRRMLESAPPGGEFDHGAVRKDLLFAPDAIERDGRYYLYFCMPDNSEGVAVANRPEGPFSNPLRLDCGGIDPAVLMDDDGKAYYYWGQINANGAPLNDDIRSMDRAAMVPNLLTEQEHFFHEGFSIRKRGDTYYAVYACMQRGKPTSLGYATAPNPLGPFTYRGIIVDNDGCDPQSWNNHGSIECVNGQWYVFYHRSSRGSQQYRRLCIEPIHFNEDGSIDEVPMTSQGAGEPFNIGERIPAWRACGLSGSVRILPGDGGEDVLASIGDGDTAVYRYVKTDGPVREVAFEFEGAAGIRVDVDGANACEGPLEPGQAILPASCNRNGPAEVKLSFSSVQPGFRLHSLKFM